VATKGLIVPLLTASTLPTHAWT